MAYTCRARPRDALRRSARALPPCESASPWPARFRSMASFPTRLPSHLKHNLAADATAPLGLERGAAIGEREHLPNDGLQRSCLDPTGQLLQLRADRLHDKEGPAHPGRAVQLALRVLHGRP